MDNLIQGDTRNQNSKPLRVVIFAGSSVCIGSLNMLHQQQLLAGVIISEQNDAFNQQLLSWLQYMSIACIQLSQQNNPQVAEQLTRWEADLAFNFAFEPAQLELYAHLPSYGLFHCHLSAYPTYQGPMPLYWQLRNCCKQVQISLQKAGVAATAPVLPMDIALKQIIEIHPLDTLQSLENKLTAQIAPLLHSFIQELEQQNGDIQLSVAEGEASLAPQVQEQDLTVNWAEMNSEQICALARAGNPHFGGGTVILGNTAFSLLQASIIDYPTYGVPAGTICYSGEPNGVIVATRDGAIRLDILSNADGIFSAVAFAERFQISAGMAFGH